MLRQLRQLTSSRRSQTADRRLGYVLAFVAGAVNAGGFIAVGQYTSHMTGIISSMADWLALGDFAMALAALAAWVAFITGAATTAILINLAHRRRLRSRFALSLLLEACLLLLFGIAGAHLAQMHDFLAPLTVLLLCFIMGLQNAIITKVSKARIRTTHVTGMSTDLGIEIGKLFYWNRSRVPLPAVRANRDTLALHGALIFCFFAGGLSGALGFKRVGYATTILLAGVLALLAAGPILAEARVRWRLRVRANR